MNTLGAWFVSIIALGIYESRVGDMLTFKGLLKLMALGALVTGLCVLLVNATVTTPVSLPFFVLLGVDVVGTFAVARSCFTRDDL